MYPHFIEVHDKDTDKKWLINVSTIEVIGDGTVDTIMTEVSVSESYDEIKRLIKETGAQIDKGDPRLDTSIPLSMDDLCQTMMIGEPVYNSNTRAWMLVIDSALDNRSWVDLVDHAGKIVRYGPHDVVKYPLYRMRKTE